MPFSDTRGFCTRVAVNVLNGAVSTSAGVPSFVDVKWIAVTLLLCVHVMVPAAAVAGGPPDVVMLTVAGVAEVHVPLAGAMMYVPAELVVILKLNCA